jgi:pyrroloquinoline quinone (PQQ) biosynthesis protein C
MQELSLRPRERLRGTLEIAIPQLAAASRDLAKHARIRELYPEYLFALHCIIRASVPLMDVARQRAAEIADHDEVAAALERYLAEHGPEEQDHDEWLLDDLEALGHDRASVLSRPPSSRVAAAVGAQYYWIFHYHPVALLGYIAVLEGYPPAAAAVDELERQTGYPSAAFRTLRLHAELDPGHRDELDLLIDVLPLTEEQAAVLGVSALSTVQSLCRVIEEIIETAQ